MRLRPRIAARSRRARRFVPPLTAWIVTLGVSSVTGAAAAPTAAQDEFFDRYGFRPVESVLGEAGEEVVVYRPDGRFGDVVELETFAAADGEVEKVSLAVTRAAVDDDPSESWTLIGAFLRWVVGSDDDVHRLAYVIESPDSVVRRGLDRSTGCCAIPPEHPEFVAAAGVVDGVRRTAHVRLPEATVSFRDVPDRRGRPAVHVVVHGPSGPEAVLKTLFEAARDEDPDLLGEICIAFAELDEDVEALCDLEAGSEAWSEFTAWFRTGTVVDVAEIDGDTARVRFRFGPEGEREETMELTRWDHRWYLRSF